MEGELNTCDMGGCGGELLCAVGFEPPIDSSVSLEMVVVALY